MLFRKTQRSACWRFAASVFLFISLAACSSVAPPDTVATVTPSNATPEPGVRLAFRACYEKAMPGAEQMQLDQQTVFVMPQDLLNNHDVASASAAENVDGQYGVSIDFTAEGRERFAKVTTELLDQRLAILVNDELIVAPIVRTPITGGRAMISGNYSKAEARRIADGIAPH